ncbi:hypothetical protein JCM30204_29040 [Dysgonomonas termitidis]|jgi:hypothetical protein
MIPYPYYQCDTAFNPTTDAINVTMKNIRIILAGSLNTIIPKSTVPAAPIPVNMAYAVPIGIVWVAFTNKPIPNIRHTPNARYQYVDCGADTIFAFDMQNVKPTSKALANNK